MGCEVVYQPPRPQSPTSPIFKTDGSFVTELLPRDTDEMSTSQSGRKHTYAIVMSRFYHGSSYPSLSAGLSACEGRQLQGTRSGIHPSSVPRYTTDPSPSFPRPSKLHIVFGAFVCFPTNSGESCMYYLSRYGTALTPLAGQ